MKKLVFYPDDPRRERVYRKYKPKNPSWVAPEHQKFAQGMKRSKRVDMDGIAVDGTIGHLIVDNRPTIMKPDVRPNPLLVTSDELCY